MDNLNLSQFISNMFRYEPPVAMIRYRLAAEQASVCKRFDGKNFPLIRLSSFAIQRFAHFGCQLLDREWFLNETDTLFQ